MKYEVIALKKGLVAIREQLKKEGDDGWELISIVHQPDDLIDVSDSFKSEYSGHIAYFKKDIRNP